MKELYNEYFHIPKHGKIRDKVMLIRTAITTIVMIVCLAAMSLTAYAYFSYNVTSGSNIIKAANFEAQITIADENNTLVNPSSTDGKITAFTFTTPGTYTVKLEKGASSTAETGFCIVYVGNDKYHTQQIGVDIHAGNSKREFVAFALKINEPNTVVTIESHWGTSSYYNYSNDESYAFYIISSSPLKEIVIGNPVNGANNSDEEKDTTSDETTATDTTPTEVIHTVAAGENLTEIADFYNTTVARIAAYNKITDPDSIYGGQKLVIPPADWEIPADTTEQTTTTTTPETTVPETTTTPETTTPETTTSAETTTPPETSATDPVDTTAPAETTTSTETTGTPETSAPAETTEPVETTSDETEATETTATSADNAE